MQLRRIEFSRFHMLRFRFDRKVTTFFSDMQGKSEKNADSLTFMCYSVTLVTLTIAKEAPASLRGLPSLWQQDVGEQVWRYGIKEPA